MIITGERTVPGIWHENYWFRRHEVVYQAMLERVRGRRVLEAGCGEGYGAALLQRSAASVIALDYDAYASSHAQRSYPGLPVVRANLVALPFATGSHDVVVSLQTIEHLWDQEQFLAECARVVRPGGLIVISTPNTKTFPPGNIYHPKELDAEQLYELISQVAEVESLTGLQHGQRIRTWESQHGSIVDAQLRGDPQTWDRQTEQIVRTVRTEDFNFSSDGLAASLDLIALARRA